MLSQKHLLSFDIPGKSFKNKAKRWTNNKILELFSFRKLCCSYFLLYFMTEVTKNDVHVHSEKDEQGSKVTDFFAKTEEMYEEMKWQKKLRSSPALFWVSGKGPTWARITLLCMLAINITICLWYPFGNQVPGKLMFCSISPILTRGSDIVLSTASKSNYRQLI